MKSILIFMFVAILNSCGGEYASNESAPMEMSGKMAVERSADLEAPMEVPLSEQPAPQQSETSEASPEKKVVRTGNQSFKVKSAKETSEAIRQALAGYNAYIENENQYTYGDRITYSMTIRVPADNFDKVFDFLAGQATYMENQSVNVEDVTARYYDLETRIKNKKVLEQRYLELLAKASTVRDILDIENQLNTVRTDIENMEGQFNYLKKQVQMSFIHLNFYEILPYSIDEGAKMPFFDRLVQSFYNGWQWFVSFLLGLVGLWPFLLLTPVVVFLWKKWRGRLRNDD